MGPQTKTVDRSSIATPFAESFLAELEGLIGGGFQGFGPRGQVGGNIATNIGQRAASGQLVRDVPDINQIAGLLRPQQRTLVRENVADLREAFGGQGRRFGTSLATGEARLRSGLEENFMATIGRIAPQLAQIGVQRDLGQAGTGLQSAGILGQMDIQNVAPFLRLALSGILPPEVVASPSVLSQILSAGASGAGTFFGAKSQG